MKDNINWCKNIKERNTRNETRWMINTHKISNEKSV